MMAWCLDAMVRDIMPADIWNLFKNYLDSSQKKLYNI